MIHVLLRVKCISQSVSQRGAAAQWIRALKISQVLWLSGEVCIDGNTKTSCCWQFVIVCVCVCVCVYVCVWMFLLLVNELQMFAARSAAVDSPTSPPVKKKKKKKKQKIGLISTWEIVLNSPWDLDYHLARYPPHSWAQQMDPVIWRALEDEELEGTQLSGLNVIDFSCKSPTFIIYMFYNHRAGNSEAVAVEEVTLWWYYGWQMKRRDESWVTHEGFDEYENDVNH